MLLKYQGVLNNKSKHIGDDAASMDEYRVLLDMSGASEKTLRIWRKNAKKGISLFQGGKGDDDWVGSSPRRPLATFATRPRFHVVQHLNIILRAGIVVAGTGAR